MPIHGGPSHQRYDHRSRPARVDVCCPACGGLARADLPDDPPPIIGDLSRRWPLNAPQWRIGCTACPHRAEALTWEALPPLFWRTSARELDLWAWNRDHLGFLVRALKAVLRADEPYAWFATYIPGRWKARRAEVVRAFERLVDAPDRYRVVG